MSARLGVFMCLASTLGCATRIPSPLEPQKTGSVGSANHGVVVALPEVAEVPGTLEFLRDNGRRYALPRFADALVRASQRVQAEAPGTPPLLLGDLSSQHGGQSLPHHSHRNGLDADLLFYITTLDGAPLATREFVHFRDDGIGYSPKLRRWVRFDEKRQWFLLRALLEDPEARIQWVFFHHNLEHLLLDWAIAHGEADELIVRASQVLLEPRPGGAHDDHFHVRTYCSELEEVHGCVPTGPVRPWIPKSTPAPLPSDWELARELFVPLPTPLAQLGSLVP